MKKWLIGYGARFGLFLMLGACAALITGGDSGQSVARKVSSNVSFPPVTADPVQEKQKVTMDRFKSSKPA
jgi:hypothetical protein